ncbi:hypothetical protein [Bacteriovorax sp. DB6_IX]|uniref:hypothetical protein n=1 Tax=Bacteriovorax sp. DB6_IX TaxID=1353530 RepID=UPI00038A269E|nr:hypothetical protein [Bacteriovorax sp. DB6_IX]EQC49992.1 hypothetical protein M901_3142 [Bacteriovorax sp. DB6_IX]
MIYNCPISTCNSSTKNKLVIKDGRYKRACDSRKIQRFRCKVCGKKFSRATFSFERYQKKRRVNHRIYRMLCDRSSMRSISRELNINYKTVARKVQYLAEKSRRRQRKFLKKLEKSQVQNMQFDDLITLEHTKMKPLSVSLAVDKKRRFILGAEVSRIPAFGHLAKKSKKKYGYRENHHERGLNRLMGKIYRTIDRDALIESDEHNTYPKIVAKYFSSQEHKRYKGGRSCVAGQGELKRQHFDPLFTLNHTCAMFRAHINRLIRKSWCSTKRVDMLQAHIDIFICFYNLDYLGGLNPI